MSGVIKNVPELRFPEFGGKWQLSKLGDVTEYTKGFAFKSESYRSSGVRVVRVSDLGADKIKNLSEAVFVSDKDVSKAEKYVIHKDNIIITTVGSRPELLESAVGRGIYVRADNEGLLNQNLLKLNNTNKSLNGFVIGYINSPRYIDFISSIQRGNANQSNITVKDLFEFDISIPCIDEQQKIADFLSSVDKKIEQLTEKHRLLTEYKKGVMQQIFTQQIRFKENHGNDYPEWEEISLKELLVTVVDNRGKTPPVSNDAQNIPLIEVNAIGGKKVNYSKVSKYVTSKVYSEWFRKHLEVGDILFSTVGQTAICSFFDGSKKAAIAQNIVGLRFSPESEKVFMFYLLTYKPNNNQFKKIEMIAVQPSVKVSQMIHINFSIPMKEEQQKIANFLTAIDQKIDQAWLTLEQTKAFKKGLLQKMFV